MLVKPKSLIMLIQNSIMIIRNENVVAINSNFFPLLLFLKIIKIEFKMTFQSFFV